MCKLDRYCSSRKMVKREVKGFEKRSVSSISFQTTSTLTRTINV